MKRSGAALKRKNTNFSTRDQDVELPGNKAEHEMDRCPGNTGEITTLNVGQCLKYPNVKLPLSPVSLALVKWGLFSSFHTAVSSLICHFCWVLRQ